MKRVIIIFLALVILSGVTIAQSNFSSIVLDADFGEWAVVPSVSDPAGDESIALDIVEVAMANNSSELYVYVRVGDAHRDFDPGTYYQYGDSSAVEYIEVYIDADNDPATGELLGPPGQPQIGVDFTISSARRTTSGTRYASSLYSGLRYENSGGTQLGNYGSQGLAGPGVLVGVNEVEELVPLSEIGVSLGDTIKYVIKASSSNTEQPHRDWLDEVQTYVLASYPATQDTSQSNYAEIDLGLGFTDWASVPRLFDTEFDAVTAHLLDFTEFAVANDNQNLYFYFEISDFYVPHLEQKDFMQYGGTSKTDYIDIHIDIDNDPGTGTLVGPVGDQIGAEWTVASARRTSSDSRSASVLYFGIHNGNDGGGTSTGFADSSGLEETSVLTGVYEFEERMPLDLTEYFGPALEPGDTIKLVARSGRLAVGLMDWIDYSVEYTIAAEPNQCGDWGYKPGDFNEDCYVNVTDLLQLSESWLNSTDPNE